MIMHGSTTFSFNFLIFEPKIYFTVANA